MSHINDLKAATSLHDVAHILGFKPKSLAYILYGIPESEKYTEFEIPKRSGGKRKINAPRPELKKLQERLSEVLQNCIDDINKSRQIKSVLSHGFRRKFSIATNANVHRKKRYVFNIDLKNFFNEINYGRVYGFFVKNKNFSLHPKVAATLAQIACFKNSLPQGSPCSPVISNLIGHILDIRLATLAARSGCYYSRYADDLTFSSKKTEFPKEIAERIAGISYQWLPGNRLESIVKKSGFAINPVKTRMQYKHFRQDVTGLIVNQKVNIKSEYARTARAMTHSLLTTGKFTLEKKIRDENGLWFSTSETGSIEQLHGILGFIDSVRSYEKKKIYQCGNNPSSTKLKLLHNQSEKLDGHESVYRKFLIFKYFYTPALPTIICEGKTDNIYMRCAINQLSTQYPTLINPQKDKINLNLFKYTETTHRLLNLSGGTGDIHKFISTYNFSPYKFLALKDRNPVIIIVDNDTGSNIIRNTAKKRTNQKETPDGSKPFYPITDNLYLILLPKKGNEPTEIEDFFEKKLLSEKLNGKTFSRKESFDKKTQYGKRLFAEAVVMKKQTEINFSGFKPILDSLVAVLDYHKTTTL